MENREIKFRAWVKDHWIGRNDRDDMIYDFQNTIHWEFYDEVPIMQFTGLQDKNGKGIYEGDIIGFDYWNKPFDRVRSEVKYDNYEAYYVSAKGGTMGVVYIMNIEIIGNIYENPELLEKQVG